MASKTISMGNPNQMKYSRGTAYGWGWHTYPGMYAGGSITFTRSATDDPKISFSGNIQNTLASKSQGSYGYPVYVEVYCGSTLVTQIHFDAPGKSYSTKYKDISGSFNLWDNNTEIKVYYCCSDRGVGNCDSKYPTGRVLVASFWSWDLPFKDYPPGVPGNQRLNGNTSLTVTERSQNFTLSWSKPSGGTYGVSGYNLYWSKGDGWRHFATIQNANQLSHTFNINTIYSGMPRGDSIGFQVQAYNSTYNSGHAPGMFDYNKLTLAKMSFNNISASEVSFYSAKINWSSNLNVKTVQYSYDGGNSWSTAQSNINTTSGNFVLSGRTSGTKYTVKVRLTAASDGTQVTKDVSFTTTAMTISVGNSAVQHYSATVNWSSNTNIKTVEYNLNNTGWKTANSGLNVKSGSFGLSGLSSNTTYTVQVRLTGYADNKTITGNTSFTTKATDVKVTTSNVTPVGLKISWSSSVNINKVQWKLSTEADSSYKNAATGLNQSSGSFTITSLKFNTSYTINVRVTGYADGKTATTSTTLKTLDIARLTAVTKLWDVDKSAEITATNPGNCALQLYIDYYANNTWVALISRAPITLTNGKYGITLTTSEINMLYKRASGDTNAKFRFTLKSLYPNLLGEHSMETKITFPTKAWVRPDPTGEWKRALVWAKDSAGTWKQVSPWVDPANNKNWKKI